MPLGYGLWVFLKNNPVVLYIGAAFAFLATFLSWQRLRDMRIRRENSEKHERAAAKEKERAVEYVETVREEAADAADKAIEARDTASPLDPERMSDAKRARIFGRSRATGEGS